MPDKRKKSEILDDIATLSVELHKQDELLGTMFKVLLVTMTRTNGEIAQLYQLLMMFASAKRWEELEERSLAAAKSKGGTQ